MDDPIFIFMLLPKHITINFAKNLSTNILVFSFYLYQITKEFAIAITGKPKKQNIISYDIELIHGRRFPLDGTKKILFEKDGSVS